MKSATLRDVALAALPILLLAALAVWVLTTFVQPAPPRRVVMSTGPLDGAYHAFALRYQAHLAGYGIQLELRPSAGSVENLRRLKAREDGVSIALVQGGLVKAEDAPGLMTLGSMYYEPVWVFYRGGRDLDLGIQLRGKRIAIGPEGSGTRAAALLALRVTGLAERPTRLSDLGGLQAAEALMAGSIDAAFYVASAEAPAVQRLLAAPGIRLLGMRRAEAISRRLPNLHRLTLPEGAVDLARNLPPRRLELLAVTANLVAVEDLHPVIVDLMLESAKKVHGGAGLFQRAGEFPAPLDAELPLSADADRFYRDDPSFLRRYLPFWMVVWVNRVLIVAIPLLILALPFLRVVPLLYRWGVRRRIYRWYGELREIEGDARRGDGDRGRLSERLDLLEQRVKDLRVPAAYSSEQYELSLYVRMVRDLLREAGAGDK
jgi:TRAP-type uncharacterized transport system substrate-binding protein